ncbi:hypothetical protein [Jiangella alba]|uniref:Uncharacterized protein n=1 Tax=Jiangella alba TaxID=561176 RepID=A0A1H5JU68_9ACTN|nr:hypothetical protein [Jiangella alba]SEE55974.1 hypothetical protein SAMN04488561_1739 [Jiangella alba]
MTGPTTCASETPADQLHQLFTQLGPEAEEAYVTTAEMLRSEGEVRGRAEAHAASSAQLENWTARVLTAESLGDVL